MVDFIGEEELKSRSQVVQRLLPRPSAVNHSILRTTEPQLNELQKVRLLKLRHGLLAYKYDDYGEYECHPGHQIAQTKKVK